MFRSFSSTRKVPLPDKRDLMRLQRVVQHAHVTALHRVHDIRVLVQAVLANQRGRGHLPHEQLDREQVPEDERLVFTRVAFAVPKRVLQMLLRDAEVIVEHREPADVEGVGDPLRDRERVERGKCGQVHGVDQVFAQVQRVELEVDFEEGDDQEEALRLLLPDGRVRGVAVDEHERGAGVSEPAVLARAPRAIRLVVRARRERHRAAN
jgi:hypothetical protein